MILAKRKKIFRKNKRRLLWISLTVFLLAYLSVVGSALYDDIYAQWNLNSYDLNKDGFFSGNEINEKQSQAMAKLTNDIGRNLSFITGIIFGLPFMILTYIGGLILTKRKKNYTQQRL
ncbi:hypothetical protein DU428_08380 [Oceanihabitans sediminis]|uniref:Uncharacterized protein n=2 Tax=Flavobacteriaceae TaxID=49546 RepID=A0A368P3D6_9FLAO|nr:hypothetical protein DU428_08380 [Oceanihabitans sediminis]